MHAMQKKVGEFFHRHGLTTDVERIEVNDQLLLRIRLINEELGELSKAVHEADLIETADALGDLYYVILGSAVTYGIELSLYNPRPVEWVPNLSTPYFATRFLLRVTESIGLLAGSFLSTSKMSVKLRLEEVAANCINMADEFNLPFESVFSEIHRSNMTKPQLDKHFKGGKNGEFSPVDLAKILGPPE